MSDEKKNYANQKSIRVRAEKLHADVIAAFEDKSDQSRNIDNFWDILNCKLNDKQEYDGDSQVYIPVVHDAIEARVKRYVSMLMPTTGRSIDVISENGDIPYETIALQEHYIRQNKMRTL